MVFKVASYRVPAQSRDSFVEAVREVIATSQKEAGVKGYRGGFDLNDGEVFTLTGLYESEDAFNNHVAAEHVTKALGTINGMEGVEFMDAATFDCTEEGNSAKTHVGGLLH
jgi:quinol monooxygenase YgiN